MQRIFYYRLKDDRIIAVKSEQFRVFSLHDAEFIPAIRSSIENTKKNNPILRNGSSPTVAVFRRGKALRDTPISMRDAEIVKRTENGQPARKVAKIMKVSLSDIYKVRHQHGIKRFSRPDMKERGEAKHRNIMDIIKPRLLNGQNYTNIADAIGSNPGTVGRHVRRAIANKEFTLEELQLIRSVVARA